MSVLNRTVLAAALLVVAPLASAGTATSNLEVSITITNSCTVTANPLDFGSQTSVDSAIDDATTITLDCTAIDSNAKITFDNGQGTGATYNSRKMTGPGTATINYGLYIDSTRATFAGDGAGNGAALVTDADGNTGSTGTVQTFDLYGRVFGSQGPKPVGSYTDTVVATVTF